MWTSGGDDESRRVDLWRWGRRMRRTFEPPTVGKFNYFSLDITTSLYSRYKKKVGRWIAILAFDEYLIVVERIINHNYAQLL